MQIRISFWRRPCESNPCGGGRENLKKSYFRIVVSQKNFNFDQGYRKNYIHLRYEISIIKFIMRSIFIIYLLPKTTFFFETEGPCQVERMPFRSLQLC
jgi:hypothetical protein